MRIDEKICTLDTLPTKRWKDGGGVLVTGVFDILHPGHLIFLEKAKAAGSMLVVGVESDKKVQEMKGSERPLHLQEERVFLVAALGPVDYAFPLPYIPQDEYEDVCRVTSCQILAVTKGDPFLARKQAVMKNVGGSVAQVSQRVPLHSTTRILRGLYAQNNS